VVGCWRGYQSGARCTLACSPADATATHCLLLHLNPDWFCLLVPAHPGGPGRRAVKRVCVGIGIDDIALVLQQNRLCWCGHVLRKDDDDWVKKCMEYEVEGPRPRGRPKRTWREVVREDCQARKLNKEDAVDRCKWRKVIKDVR